MRLLRRGALLFLVLSRHTNEYTSLSMYRNPIWGWQAARSIKESNALHKTLSWSTSIFGSCQEPSTAYARNSVTCFLGLTHYLIRIADAKACPNLL
jgi:hypothetical protein